MDGTRFDRLSRALAARSGRRQVLAGLIGGAVAAATGREAFAQDEGLTIEPGPPPSDALRAAQAERAKNNRRCKDLDQTCKNEGDCCGDLTCKGNKKNKRCVCRGKACFIKEWGSYGTNVNRNFNSPYDVAVHTRTGDVFVADTFNQRVLQFDENGKFIRQFSSPPGRFLQPVSIAVDSSRNRVYVADAARNLVMRYNINGSFDMHLQGGGALNQPFGVAVNTGDGRVYVVDSGNLRVQRYDANGNFDATFATRLGRDRDLRSPSGIALSRSIYVANQTTSPRIVEVNFNNNYRQQFSQRLSQPWNMDASQRRLYVADAGGNQVVIYDDDGDFRAVFGRTGANTMTNPRGVAANGKTIYVADTFAHQIQKWVVR